MSTTSMRRNIATLNRWHALAHTIKHARLARGWPMRQFARLSGIFLGYLGLIEASRCPPPSDAVLMRMAEVLDIPAQTLLLAAGRLPPATLLAFWSHPAIPPVLSTIPGMTLDDAQAFCAHMCATLQPTPHETDGRDH
jgi:transcriptional regulator with XRE-family HTH domain